MTTRTHIKKRKSLLIATLILVVVSYRIFFLTTGFVERCVAFITYPFITGASCCAQGIEWIRSSSQSYHTLYQKHEDLKSKYHQLLESTTAALGIQQYEQETADLREFKARYKLEQSILGKVIVKTITDSEQTFLLNRGLAHGVTQDMIALYKLQIVGRVLEVYDYYCKILLITDKRCKVASYTNTTQAHGIIEGVNDIARCSLSFVSHLKPLANHDFILSSGEGLVFPEGFCLGVIAHHEKKVDNLYHTITVTPLVDLSSLTHCLLTNQAKLSPIMNQKT